MGETPMSRRPPRIRACRIPAMAAEAKARSPRRRAIVLAVKLILLAAVVVWVGQAMIDAYGKVDFSQLSFEPWWIAIGLGAIALGALSAAWVFRGFYRKMGTPLNLRQGVALLTMPMLGAYLPGRALCVAGHMGIARAMGVSLTAAGAGVVLLAGLGLLAALLVGLGFLLIQPIPGIDPKYMRISLAATLAWGPPMIILRSGKRRRMFFARRTVVGNSWVMAVNPMMPGRYRRMKRKISFWKNPWAGASIMATGSRFLARKAAI